MEIDHFDPYVGSMQNKLIVALFASMFATVGCVSGDAGTGTGTGNGTGNGDGNGNGNGDGTGGNNAVCKTATAKFGTVTGTPGQAFLLKDPMDASAPPAVISFIEMNAAPDVLAVSLYPGAGAFAAGNIKTGTFQITGDDADPQRCGLCVDITAKATEAGAAGQYFATSGTVKITAAGTTVGAKYTWELSNATFEEIDDQGMLTGGQCELSITSAKYTGTLEAEPSN